MQQLITKYGYVLLSAALMALAGAYVAEYYFDIKPCLLCLYQRYAWWGLVVLSLTILVSRKLPQKNMAFILGVYCLGLTGLSTYQVLIEEKHIEPSHACKTAAGISTGPKTADELWNSMSQKPLAACDQVAFKWHGLSLAAYSGLLSTALAILCFFSWFYCPRSRGRYL